MIVVDHPKSNIHSPSSAGVGWIDWGETKSSSAFSPSAACLFGSSIIKVNAPARGRRCLFPTTLKLVTPFGNHRISWWILCNLLQKHCWDQYSLVVSQVFLRDGTRPSRGLRWSNKAIALMKWWIGQAFYWPLAGKRVSLFVHLLAFGATWCDSIMMLLLWILLSSRRALRF